MRGSYSTTWCISVVKNLQGSYPRATNFLQRKLGINNRNLVDFLKKDPTAWNDFKYLTHKMHDLLLRAALRHVEPSYDPETLRDMSILCIQGQKKPPESLLTPFLARFTVEERVLIQARLASELPHTDSLPEQLTLEI